MPVVDYEQSEVEDILNTCSESEDLGKSAYPGMTFEQGVRYSIEWLIEGGEPPL